MGMTRILSELLLCCSTACLLGVAAQLSGEEPSDDNLKKLADDSRSRAEAIEVSVAIGDRTTKAKVCPDPIMKYTDPPRQIEMATLWVWQVEGCPVALGKVEAYRRPGGPSWLYCFASTSTGLVEGQWPDGHRFPASHAGIEWKAIDGPAPLETAAGRQRQMKELFRRFSATVFDDHAKTSDALRPLARPLHEYSSPRQGILQGIFCGLTANGTNPDAIVALEAVGPEKGKEGPKSWRYGVVPMTATGVIVKLDKAEVFTRQPEWRPGDHEKWTYFWEGTPKK
jgi:hypothetical protein